MKKKEMCSHCKKQVNVQVLNHSTARKMYKETYCKECKRLMYIDECVGGAFPTGRKKKGAGK